MSKILVVGASSGIGAALVAQLKEASFEVITAGRANEQGNPNHLQFDLDNPSTFPNLEYDLQGIVYCPGSITLKPFKNLKLEDFLRDYEINVLGAIKILQKYLPNLQKSEQASVVLFSTVAVKIGMPFHASIAAAKGAVEALCKSLAAEWAPKIRVNCIAPSLTDTPLASRLLDTEAKRTGAIERHPLKRIGNANEIASLAKWLLSNEAAFITGQVIGIDGGISAVKL